MSPKHSIQFCPICGGGLCGLRICGLPLRQNTPGCSDDAPLDSPHSVNQESTDATCCQHFPHGLIVCDECEAIWLDPDVGSPHQYPNACDPRCPICSEPLWGPQSRWATRADLDLLRWRHYANPDLDCLSEQEPGAC